MSRTRLFSVRIADCRVDTFCTGGPGGANQNATKNGVRVVHPPSGAVGESRELRHQRQNKQAAFRRMAETPVFQRWARRRAAELAGAPTIDAQVEAALAPEYLRVEVRDASGRWVAA